MPAQFDIPDIATFLHRRGEVASRERLRGRSDAFGSEARRVKVKQVGEQSEKFHGGRGQSGNSAECRVCVCVCVRA